MVQFSRRSITQDDARVQLSEIIRGVEEVGYRLEFNRVEFQRFVDIFTDPQGRRHSFSIHLGR